jgi:FkbM family methyltransferase
MYQNLIYDVGAHNGDDTAYYLRRGFRVVAIEANPVMAAALATRFSREIDDGRLILLNVGVAEKAGEFEFWVCDDVSEWSSFIHGAASRNGARHHSVTIEARRFGSILSRYGVPLYCKIDIEGHDQVCLAELDTSDLPRFVSIEMNLATSGDGIELLYELGYRKFKIISQVTWTQPLPIISRYEYALGKTAQRYLHRIDRRLRGVRYDGAWKFPFGSSGTFGERTSGPWRSRQSVLRQWQMLRDADARFAANGVGGNWHDIHASLD